MSVAQLREPPRQRRELGCRLLDRDAGAKPAEEIHLALCGFAERPVERSRQPPDVGAGRVVEVARNDARDGETPLSDGEAATYDVRRAAVAPLPQRAADDDDVFRSVDIVCVCERAPSTGLTPSTRKISP